MVRYTSLADFLLLPFDNLLLRSFCAASIPITSGPNRF